MVTNLSWLFLSSSCSDIQAGLFPCCPSQGTSVWPPDQIHWLRWTERDEHFNDRSNLKQVTCEASVFEVIHLLPRAQASSLPRKPPPMIVMELMFLETLSKDLKSSIWKGGKKLKCITENKNWTAKENLHFWYILYAKHIHFRKILFSSRCFYYFNIFYVYEINSSHLLQKPK